MIDYDLPFHLPMRSMDIMEASIRQTGGFMREKQHRLKCGDFVMDRSLIRAGLAVMDTTNQKRFP